MVNVGVELKVNECSSKYLPERKNANPKTMNKKEKERGRGRGRGSWVAVFGGCC